MIEDYIDWIIAFALVLPALLISLMSIFAGEPYKLFRKDKEFKAFLIVALLIFFFLDLALVSYFLFYIPKYSFLFYIYPPERYRYMDYLSAGPGPYLVVALCILFMIIAGCMIWYGASESAGNPGRSANAVVARRVSISSIPLILNFLIIIIVLSFVVF